MSCPVEPSSKKARVCDREDDTLSNESLVRANKVIKLKFLESVHPLRFSTNEPEFTHQLFKDEEIDFLDTGIEYEVQVYINSCDLAHSVVYSKNITSIDRQLLIRNMENGLPPDTVHVSQPVSNKIFDTFESRPPGKLISTVSMKDDVYEMYLATAVDEGALQLLSRGEKIAMWYIETADSVDFSDSHWEAVFMYRRVKPVASSPGSSPSSSSGPTRLFAGYFTLYTFNNPFQGDKLRICQCLVLPTLQGKGLGRAMMLRVYELVRDRQTVEITVEDPCSGFQALRDNVDLEWCASTYRDKKGAHQLGEGRHALHDLVTTLSAADMGKELKIIKAQAVFVQEALAYLKLLSEHGEDKASPFEHSAEFKEYRLKIKRRLFKGDPELKLMSKSEMQDELSRMFEVELKRFRGVVKTAQRLGLV